MFWEADNLLTLLFSIIIFGILIGVHEAGHLIAAKKCGVDRGKCLVFEDVINAAKSAKSAGMKVCGVFDERSRAHREDMKNLCDFYIDSFKELIKEE